MTTRQRTINYREPDSDSDDDVIYVGQRTVSRAQRIVPTPTRPDIILGEEDYLAEPIVKPVKEQTTVEVFDEERVVDKEIVLVEHNGCGLLQTLPYEVRSLYLPRKTLFFPTIATILALVAAIDAWYIRS